MMGVPQLKEAFQEVIHEFFSPVAIESFEKENGPIVFKKLEKMVEYYNFRTTNKNVK
jgi:hypothetical protein